MAPSKLPSPSKKTSEQKERCARPAAPRYQAECHQLTESLLALTPTRTRYPPPHHSTEQNVIQSSKAASAGKSAVITPSTPLSNTSKRRNAIANLSRTAPHPSHGVRMAQIFQDAANEIERSSTRPSTPGSTPANTKRSRIPFLSARRPPASRTTHLEQEALVSPTRRPGPARASPTRSELIESFPTPALPRNTAPPAAASKAGQEPISSGFSSPAKSPARLASQDMAITLALPSVSQGLSKVIPPSPIEETAAPPPTPSRVDDWLNGILDIPPIICPPTAVTTKVQPKFTDPPNQSPTTHLSPSIPNLKHRISLTSDKENIPPSTVGLSWSSIASSSPRQRLTPTASQFRSKEARAQRKKAPLRPPQRRTSPSSSFSIRDLPRRHITRTTAQVFQPSSEEPPLALLSLEPKRKRLRLTPSQSSSDASERLVESPGSMPNSEQGSSAGKENVAPFEIFSEAEVEFHDRVTGLSPKVEVFRKGRGPRKERCGSYWDEDILGVGSAEAEEGERERRPSREVKKVFEFSSEKGFVKRVVLGELE